MAAANSSGDGNAIFSETACANGSICLPSRGTTNSVPASPTPMMLAPLNMPPVAYHSIESEGMEPLSRSMICQPARDGEVRKVDVRQLDVEVREEPLDGVYDAAHCVLRRLDGLVMASITPLKMPCTVPTKLSKVLVMVFQIPSTTPPMVELMAFQMLLATLNTLFQMEDHTL